MVKVVFVMFKLGFFLFWYVICNVLCYLWFIVVVWFYFIKFIEFFNFVWNLYMEELMYKEVILYWMVISGYICLFGFKLKDLFKCEGFKVDDRYLSIWEEIDVFK